MEEELQRQTFSDYEELHKFTKQASQLLMLARDTEPMLFNGLTYALSVLEEEALKVPLMKGDQGGFKEQNPPVSLRSTTSLQKGGFLKNASTGSV